MPVSVVVGGQFGSEGKGKVAYEIARRHKSAIVVRVGGANSGHTVIDAGGKVRRFRALPTASILPDTMLVIAAGSYIDSSVLIAEIDETQLDPTRLVIDPNAILITDDHRKMERAQGLRARIASTISGTGAAVISRLLRDGSAKFVESNSRLKAYVQDTHSYLRHSLKSNARVVIEGTQGFGLSVLHSQDYPYTTARDTTAAGFVSEAGLSPLDVDEVVIVLRAFPIRVAGNSGPLPNEIDWETVTRESGYQHPVVERSTVTDRIRRVARFDASVVRAAMLANNPNQIVLNHLDYVDASCRKCHCISEKAEKFVSDVERKIGAKIDYVGLGPAGIVARSQGTSFANSAAKSA